MLDKICPICGNPMTLIDHDDSDGLFAGWEWQCSNCDNKEKEGEQQDTINLPSEIEIPASIEIFLLLIYLEE